MPLASAARHTGGIEEILNPVPELWIADPSAPIERGRAAGRRGQPGGLVSRSWRPTTRSSANASASGVPGAAE
jgi:hypothetical protein